MDPLTAVLLVGLAIFAFWNRVKLGAAADTLGNLVNDHHTDNALRIFKKMTTLEITLLKKRIDAMEKALQKDRSSQQARQEDRSQE